MQRYPASSPDMAPLLLFAHGAGAGESHPWIRHVAQGLANRGISVVTFDFPYVQGGRKRPDQGPVLEEAFRAAWETAVHELGPGMRLFAGGKSMGGRIASQAAARGTLSPQPAGLLFFGYPLHPPRAASVRRDRHLPAVQAPMLFLHGTRDPFGTPAEMRTLVADLTHATLHLVEGGDHSLQPPKRTDPEGRSMDLVLDTAAGWILGESGTSGATPAVPL